MNDVLKAARKRAKDSLKILETLERGTLEKAKDLVKLAKLKDRSKKTNERILSSLERLGVATQREVTELKTRIKDLEDQLSTQKNK